MYFEPGMGSLIIQALISILIVVWFCKVKWLLKGFQGCFVDKTEGA